MDKGNKQLVGAVVVLGLALIANTIYTVYITPNASLKAVDQAKTAPSEWYDADYVSPIATVAAPRMYVSHAPGSNGRTNPGESWLMGGGASITSTTGRWAA